MGLERTTDAAVEPLSTAEAKAHLRVTTSAEDTLIDRLVKAARMAVENEIGRALITQTWKLRIDYGWPTVRVSGEDRLRIVLPRPPLGAVTSVKYVDATGAEQTLAADQYQVSGKRHLSVIEPAYGVTWPAVRSQLDAVTVEYTAGYGATGASVPEPIRNAMLLLVGNWYESRSEVVLGTIATQLPAGAQALLFPYRIFYE